MKGTTFDQWYDFAINEGKESGRDTADMEDFKPILEAGWNKCVTLNVIPLVAEVKRLYAEVQILRRYGNKDCTHMADDCMKENGIIPSET